MTLNAAMNKRLKSPPPHVRYTVNPSSQQTNIYLFTSEWQTNRYPIHLNQQIYSDSANARLLVASFQLSAPYGLIGSLFTVHSGPDSTNISWFEHTVRHGPARGSLRESRTPRSLEQDSLPSLAIACPHPSHGTKTAASHTSAVICHALHPLPLLSARRRLVPRVRLIDCIFAKYSTRGNSYRYSSCTVAPLLPPILDAGLDARQEDETTKLEARSRRSQHTVLAGMCVVQLGGLERPWLQARWAREILVRL